MQAGHSRMGLAERDNTTMRGQIKAAKWVPNGTLQNIKSITTSILEIPTFRIVRNKFQKSSSLQYCYSDLT